MHREQLALIGVAAMLALGAILCLGAPREPRPCVSGPQTYVGRCLTFEGAKLHAVGNQAICVCPGDEDRVILHNGATQ